MAKTMETITDQLQIKWSYSMAFHQVFSNQKADHPDSDMRRNLHFSFVDVRKTIVLRLAPAILTRPVMAQATDTIRREIHALSF